MEQRKKSHADRETACQLLISRSKAATKTIRTVLLIKRILFLGRFELDRGAIIHKSPTSAVIKKAIDRSTKDEYRMALRDIHKEDDTYNRSKRTVTLENRLYESS
jgi:hypothetical protein